MRFVESDSLRYNTFTLSGPLSAGTFVAYRVLTPGKPRDTEYSPVVCTGGVLS